MLDESKVGLKANREQCYKSRDFFFKCCSENNEDESKCKKEKKDFDRDCPASWLRFLSFRNKEAVSGDNLAGTEKNPSIPYHLKIIGFCSLNDELGLNQIEALKQLKTVDDRKILKAMYDYRLYNAARTFIKVRLLEYSKIDGLGLLHMCEFLKNLYLDGNSISSDSDVVVMLRKRLLTLPKFLTKTAELYLDSCEITKKIPEVPENTVDRAEVIIALLGSYLRNGQIELFKTLLKSEPKVSILASLSLVAQLAKAVTLKPNVCKVFLNRLVAEGAVANISLLPTVEQICQDSGKWRVQRTKVGFHGVCHCCGINLNNEFGLSEKEFIYLRDCLREYMFELAERHSLTVPDELIRFTHSLRQFSKMNKKQIVVDGLNSTSGIKNDSLLYEILLKAKQDFGEVILISRGMESRKFKEKIAQIGIRSFACSKWSDDDLYVLMSALECGPNCYILSNDRYRLYHCRLKSPASELCEHWLQTRVVQHRCISTPRFFYPPQHNLATQRNNSSIHVAFVEKCTKKMRADVYSWLCVREVG
uniref:PRORP domain-containing protein n=1 Tax=Syphacia muris TaxID=451379 RepID=A0A0N5ALZ7_9BILA